VLSGLAAAKSKGVPLGRPRRTVDPARIAELRKAGYSWAKISAELSIGEGTARRAVQKPAKNPSEIRISPRGK
jgi:DNA invertase Pin-like site-specific DNA recombinase